MNDFSPKSPCRPLRQSFTEEIGYDRGNATGGEQYSKSSTSAFQDNDPMIFTGLSDLVQEFVYKRLQDATHINQTDTPAQSPVTLVWSPIQEQMSPGSMGTNDEEISELASQLMQTTELQDFISMVDKQCVALVDSLIERMLKDMVEGGTVPGQVSIVPRSIRDSQTPMYQESSPLCPAPDGLFYAVQEQLDDVTIEALPLTVVPNGRNMQMQMHQSTPSKYLKKRVKRSPRSPRSLELNALYTRPPKSKTTQVPIQSEEIEVIDLTGSDDKEPQVQSAIPVNIRSLIRHRFCDSWLTDDVVSILIKMRTAGTNIIPMDVSWFLIGNRATRNRQMQGYLAQIESNPEKKLVMPFCWKGRWRLLMIDNINISCYDPKEPGKTFKRTPKVVELSKDFNLPLVSLRHVGPMQATGDDMNGGIFVVLTVETLCNNRQWQYQDVLDFRAEVLEELDNDPSYSWTYFDVGFKELPVPKDVEQYYTGKYRSYRKMLMEKHADTTNSVCMTDHADKPAESQHDFDGEVVTREMFEPERKSILKRPIISTKDPSSIIEPMKKQKYSDALDLDCPRDFQESVVPYEKPSKETTLFVAFAQNKVDLLRTEVQEFTQSDLRSAAENVMVFLGAKKLADLHELTKESANYLETELEEFIGTLENVQVPEDLLEASKKFCVKYYKK